MSTSTATFHMFFECDHSECDHANYPCNWKEPIALPLALDNLLAWMENDYDSADIISRKTAYRLAGGDWLENLLNDSGNVPDLYTILDERINETWDGLKVTFDLKVPANTDVDVFANGICSLYTYYAGIYQVWEWEDGGFRAEIARPMMSLA